MNKPVSIFDGWTKQIRYSLEDGEGGYCALGWMREQVNDGVISDLEMTEAYDRIQRWIAANIDGITTLHGANNEGHLDIEGFRLVDLLSQGYVPDDSDPPATVAGTSPFPQIIRCSDLHTTAVCP